MKQDSVELIYETVVKAIDTQQAFRASLESKASTLTAFAGGVFAFLMGSADKIVGLRIDIRQTIYLSVGLFAVSVVLTTFVTWVVSYRTDPDPEALAKHFFDKPEDETRRQVLSNLVDAWKRNSAAIENKAKILRIAFFVQALAFLTLGIAFLIAIW